MVLGSLVQQDFLGKRFTQNLADGSLSSLGQKLCEPAHWAAAIFPNPSMPDPAPLRPPWSLLMSGRRTWTGDEHDWDVYLSPYAVRQKGKNIAKNPRKIGCLRRFHEADTGHHWNITSALNTGNRLSNYADKVASFYAKISGNQGASGIRLSNVCGISRMLT